jgi:hypothetical protein
MTGDKVEKEAMVFGHLSDLEMAGKVRMLYRDQLDHEAVCVGARDRIMYLSQQNEELSQRVCDDCDPENYGWVFNRVEGRGACTCMLEAEPFQILLTALETIRKAATGEIQIAEDDTEGMGWIAKKAMEALQSVLPLDYAGEKSEPYDKDMEREY